MKLKINESFASSYNIRRKKEELARLKSKYGDVKLDEEKEEESDESSSSDSDIDEEGVLKDTRELEVINALMRKDPRINDPNFAWYSSSDDEETKMESRSSNADTSGVSNKKQLFLRDIERLQLMKKEEKAEEEEEDSDVSGDVDNDMTDLSELKKAFIGAAAASGRSGAGSLFTLKTNSTKDSISTTDVEVNEKKHKDELLLDYVKKICATGKSAKTNFRFMSDSESDSEEEDNEDEGEEIFMKKYESSEGSSDEIFVPKSSQTEVKSHPRKIPDSMRIAAEGKKKRSEKNREVRERKRKEKESKKTEIEMDLKKKVELELLEFKRLKKEAAQNRINKIKRTADTDKLKIEVNDLDEDWDPEKHDQMVQKMFGGDYDGDVEETKPVFSDDEELDRDLVDWDEWKPGKCLPPAELDGDAVPEEEEPQTSHDVEERGGGGSRRRRRRRRLAGFRRALEKVSNDKTDEKTGRYKKEEFPEGFDEFIDRVYGLDCEDIILGRGEGQQDIKCRFKYRNVEPMDFGLSAEEVLSAPAKELNSWVSLKRITQIRSRDEEERDKRLYSSFRRQNNKSRLLPTVFVPIEDDDEVKEEDEASITEEATTESGEKSKKKRKAKKKKKSQEVKPDSDKKQSKKRKPLERVSDARISKLIRTSK